MLQDTLAGCGCVQAETQRGKKTKIKDIKTARDADESGEVYAAKPFFFSILLSAMPGELLCHCAGLLSVKRSLD